jgi:hypothetical protein
MCADSTDDEDEVLLVMAEKIGTSIPAQAEFISHLAHPWRQES